MKEITYIVDAEITLILKTICGKTSFTDYEKKNIAQLIKERLDVDDVEIIGTKAFVRDLDEEKKDAENTVENGNQ